jgi:1,4-dihydroxy-2-naphthoyl-CoA synthase
MLRFLPRFPIRSFSSAASQVKGLKFGHEGEFYRIHYDRPEKFNSITVDMYRGLNAALKEANTDPKVKFTVFSGKATLLIYFNHSSFSFWSVLLRWQRSDYLRHYQEP